MDSFASMPEQNGTRKAEKRKRKNIMGRCTRRRQAKLRDIEAAEERIWSGETEVLVATKSVPTDRDIVWPGVLERRKGSLTSTEEATLVGQLGYLPGNAICVAARAQQVPALTVDDSVPIVLKLYPLVIRDVYAGGKSNGRKFKGRRRVKISRTANGNTSTNQKDEPSQDATDREEPPLLEPFPTHYWLTHPLLRILTSKLELTNNVSLMEDQLQSDPQALESMVRAHQAYGQERWENLTETDINLVKERKWEPALDSRRGVAGIKRHTTIKCLHAHLAHYLSGGRGSEDNIVGKWVMESVAKILQEKKVTPETADQHKISLKTNDTKEQNVDN